MGFLSHCERNKKENRIRKENFAGLKTANGIINFLIR
jgi:hypothetical protein